MKGGRLTLATILGLDVLEATLERAVSLLLVEVLGGGVVGLGAGGEEIWKEKCGKWTRGWVRDTDDEGEGRGKG